MGVTLGKGGSDFTIGDIATKSPFVAYPDQTLDKVLGVAEGEYGRIPVVSRDDPATVSRDITAS